MSFKNRNTEIKDADVAVIAGIKCHVYGIANIDNSKPVVLAMVLHPRTSNYEYSAVIGSEITLVPNVVAVAFDLPNHGSRIIEDRANQDWRIGNPTHGQDLATCIELAASEAEVIARYIPAYFEPLERAAATGDLIRVAVGASLGGHIAWRIAIGPHGPFGSRLFSGILPIVGCPYVGEMLQKRVGEQSANLPLSAMQNLEEFNKTTQLKDYPNFRILALVGGKDKYVPPSYTEKWAKGNNNAHQKVIVDENAGHETSNFMLEQAIDWFKQLHKDFDRDTTVDLGPSGRDTDVGVISSERPLEEDN